MIILSINMLIIYIAIPILVLQYALALFCLSKLAYIKLATKQYVLWNIVIMLAFFVGGIVFLIVFRKAIAAIPKKTAKVNTEASISDDVSGTVSGKISSSNDKIDENNDKNLSEEIKNNEETN